MATDYAIPYDTIEPDAVRLVDGGDNQVRLSIAISLKRIADELTGGKDHKGIAELVEGVSRRTR